MDGSAAGSGGDHGRRRRFLALPARVTEPHAETGQSRQSAREASTGNQVTSNNRPNMAPTTSPLRIVPSGTGILGVAADRTLFQDNFVTSNNTVGLGVIANPLPRVGPRVDHNPPDGNRVIANTVVGNGGQPDLPRTGGRPGSDIIYDGTGTGNCFSMNRAGTQCPPGITAAFACA